MVCDGEAPALGLGREPLGASRDPLRFPLPPEEVVNMEAREAISRGAPPAPDPPCPCCPCRASGLNFTSGPEWLLDSWLAKLPLPPPPFKFEFKFEFSVPLALLPRRAKAGEEESRDPRVIEPWPPAAAATGPSTSRP